MPKDEDVLQLVSVSMGVLTPETHYLKFHTFCQKDRRTLNILAVLGCRVQPRFTQSLSKNVKIF